MSTGSPASSLRQAALQPGLDTEIVRGTLRRDDDGGYVEAPDGSRRLRGETIWRGYLEHFAGLQVFARALAQCDYERGRPIRILWPQRPEPPEPCVELYYNERLVKYVTSSLGHNAVNVHGRIYNFSHLMNENEVLTPEEYFYRPALGAFAPSPATGGFELREDGRAYLDKFGRRFMRTIHAVRVFGMDTARLAATLDATMERIHATSAHPGRAEKWRDFHPVARNCTTLIRDGFNACGFPEVGGRFPRDLFVSAAYHLARRSDLRVEIVTLPQLKVAEAPYSATTLLLAPGNYWRRGRLPAPRVEAP